MPRLGARCRGCRYRHSGGVHSRVGPFPGAGGTPRRGRCLSAAPAAAESSSPPRTCSIRTRTLPLGRSVRPLQATSVAVPGMGPSSEQSGACSDSENVDRVSGVWASPFDDRTALPKVSRELVGSPYVGDLSAKTMLWGSTRRVFVPRARITSIDITPRSTWRGSSPSLTQDDVARAPELPGPDRPGPAGYKRKRDPFRGKARRVGCCRRESARPAARHDRR